MELVIKALIIIAIITVSVYFLYTSLAGDVKADKLVMEEKDLPGFHLVQRGLIDILKQAKTNSTVEQDLKKAGLIDGYFSYFKKDDIHLRTLILKYNTEENAIKSFVPRYLSSSKDTKEKIGDESKLIENSYPLGNRTNISLWFRKRNIVEKVDVYGPKGIVSEEFVTKYAKILEKKIP